MSLLSRNHEQVLTPQSALRSNSKDFGGDGKEEDNTLPPIIAALGSVPYTISAVFKAFSMRVDKSTRRARRTAQSKCQQATNFFGWLVRLVIPIAPLLAYASKHMIKSWANVIMNEDLGENV